MTRRGAAFLAAAALACSGGNPGPSPELELARARGSAAEREWRTYLGDAASSQSSPLDQIHRGNVAQLEVAWRYDSSDGEGYQIQFNPLVAKGVLYGTSPSLRLFALDAANGTELWSFVPDFERQLWTPSRGVAYWEDGEDERIFFGAGPYLHALDARSGRLIESFGTGGRIDLRRGLGRDLGDDFMGVVLTGPGAVFEDLIIMGGRVNEGHGAAPGHIRAFDVRSGELRWIFHTIPQPGEFGYDTWPADAWQRSGGANVWSGFGLDVERGLVFAPTGSAAFDFYGADREGDNLFANSLIALDARTGKRRWHFQTVRHDVWDRDLPAPPNLVEIERDGERIPAVAQVTKTGDTFVFHRETGEPLFPLREEPVNGPGLDGEFTAKSQPLPTRPPPFTRHEFTLDTVSDRTPAIYAQLTARVSKLRYGPLYTPPSVEGSIEYPGIDGGAEWGGAAWDSETGLLYVNANQVPYVLQMIEMDVGDDSLRSPAGGYVFMCAGCHGLDMRGTGSTVPSLIDASDRMGFFDVYRTMRDGRGRMPGFAWLEWYQAAAVAWFVATADAEDAPSEWRPTGANRTFVNAGYQQLLDADGLPGAKPPWGTLNAIDLSAGELRWQVPLGDYPKLLGLGESGYGAENYGGPVVTSGGLVFIAATPDARLRAFDKRSGEILWEAELPAAGFATPAVYESDGRQFVVIAAGGGKLGAASGGEYMAFALPLGSARD